MTVRLILARHGNTFGPGDTPVQVGRYEDLPLVERGREQARELANRLRERGLTPGELFVSPLRRACEFGEIANDAGGWGCSAVVDDRLIELDYGAWGGLTRDGIVAQFGSDEVDAWESRAEFPPAGRWGVSRVEVEAGVAAFAGVMAERAHGTTVLAVSSNGAMRFFLGLVEGEFERRLAEGSAKTGTGKFGVMTFDGERWSVDAWNV